jgi:hypothetical protein
MNGSESFTYRLASAFAFLRLYRFLGRLRAGIRFRCRLDRAGRTIGQAFDLRGRCHIAASSAAIAHLQVRGQGRTEPS